MKFPLAFTTVVLCDVNNITPHFQIRKMRNRAEEKVVLYMQRKDLNLGVYTPRSIFSQYTLYMGLPLGLTSPKKISIVYWVSPAFVRVQIPWCIVHYSASIPVFPNWGNFVPQRTLGKVWRYYQNCDDGAADM